MVAAVARLGPAMTPGRRWQVCCGRCRRAAYQPGCTRCQDRDQHDYAAPHPDDLPGYGAGYTAPEYPDWPPNCPRPSRQGPPP